MSMPKLLPFKSFNKPQGSQLTHLPAYNKLEQHYLKIKRFHMRRLFSVEPHRFNRFSIKYKGILLDYSKNRICPETIKLLCELAREVKLEDWRERMFTGDKINNTENRAVLHTALRNRSNTPILVDGKDIMPGINASLDKMEVFSRQVRRGEWKGYSGKPITDVINIGIGGSDLGPKMVYESLKPYWHDRLHVHFVSNVDGEQINETLQRLNPETSLFIISSKSFTTHETLKNAQAAREWFLQKAKNKAHINKHFVAVSSNLKEVKRYGIAAKNSFEMWDWVGGRYSLWSAIGLPVVLSIGMKKFKKMLSGAHAMDQHFRVAPLEKNMPVIMGLLGIWYNNYFKAESCGIFPYDYSLRSLPMYLEQADMESNGKSVDRNGNKVDYETGSIIWGTCGNNGQHTFFQSLHQGTKMIPADFIVSLQPHDPQQREEHDILIANVLAKLKH